MPELLLAFILLFGGAFVLLFALACFDSALTKSNNKKELFFNMLMGFGIILLFVGGWFWWYSGDCKHDGIEYIKIERKDSLKYFVYNNHIYELDKTVDDKEFKIKITKWENQWKNGIYYHIKNPFYKEIVPINEKETAEKQVDK
jgi:hypothetical protein